MALYSVSVGLASFNGLTKFPVKRDNVADIKDDNLKPLDNSVPAFPGSDDDDFEPKIITDPNLKPKVRCWNIFFINITLI